MQITVVTRIVLGLSISAVLIVFLAIAAIINQARVSNELSGLTEQASPAVNAAYELALALQNANRAVTQHASVVDADQLVLREQQFAAANSLTEQRLTDLKTKLAFSAVNLKVVGELQTQVKTVLELGKVHIGTRNELLSAQQLFSSHYAELLAQWNNYESDAKIIDRILFNLNDLGANEQSNTRTAGDGKYVQDRMPLARAVFNTLPTLTTLEAIDEAFADIQKNDQRIETRMQRIKQDAALLHEKFLPYVTLIKEAAVIETSVIGNYRTQLELQFLSTEQLGELATDVNQVIDTLSTMIADLNRIAEQNIDNIDHANLQSRTTMYGVSILALVIALIVGVSTVIAIKKPLTRISKALQQIAQGDLTAHLTVTRRDEFGVIAQGVQSLVDSVKDIISELKTNATSVQENTQKVTKVTQLNGKLLDDQRTQTENVSVAAEELHQSAIQISESAKESSARVDEVSRLLSQGNSQLDDSVNAINILVAELQEAAGVVKKVEDESNNISKILEVIQSIAEQTNLLALNAAIEAARAGEQGRGFAVVADEVRSLASRTAQSTLEINTMISALQTSAESAAGIMAGNLTRSGVVVKNASETKAAIGQVTSELRQIADISSHIATGTHEQQDNITHVSQSISTIAELSKQVSVQAHENLETFKLLAKMTDNQAQLAKKFKT